MSDFKYKHGLTIMRAQPFHIGHALLIDRMLKDCERVPFKNKAPRVTLSTTPPAKK